MYASGSSVVSGFSNTAVVATPVPVELVSFTASLSNNMINLSWTTATETNNAGFEIQRSVNKNNFNTIGYIEGQGTTTELTKYSFADQTEPGHYLYRLKQIDYDGSYSYSSVVEIDFSSPAYYELEQNYPNPFNPTTTINYHLPVEGLTIMKLYDLLGREVLTLINEYKPAGNYSVELNARDLSSGTYIYTLQSGTYYSSKKLILIK